MSKLLKGLNSSQREAVTHGTGPLLIIAGPGSGKTRTVAHSIAYAIENGVQPDRILAFSFTGKACSELRKQVKELIDEEEGNLVQIFTFHGFCRKVLRKDIEELRKGYTRNFKELKLQDQRDEVDKHIAKVRAQINYLQSHKFPNTKQILDFITRCKLGSISSSASRKHAPDPEMSQAYLEICERYESARKDNGWIDYADQLLLTNELFTSVPNVKTKWQEYLDLVFVDEYQDTDPVQYRIVNHLAEDHQNLRVVGDDDQGIYGFRGADIQNILNFKKDYPTAKEIRLQENYRSTQRIVAASNALVKCNPDLIKKELFTWNFEGENVKHLHCKSAAVEEPLESMTHLFIRPELVLGIDPGNIYDAIEPNIGWAITQKSPEGYTVVDCNTETPIGEPDDKLRQIECQINKLIASYTPDAIAVEKLEGATDKGLIGVAGCVALVRYMADQHGIERAFYSPQQVKYAATGNRSADKEPVEAGVKKRCGPLTVQNNKKIDDHSADAIAASLCYLGSYLNSSRLQLKKRKQKHYNFGLVYLSNGQYETAAAEFQKAINIEPVYADAHCGLGWAYVGQGDLGAAENSANQALKLSPNCQPAHALLENIKQKHCERGRDYFAQHELTAAENSVRAALRLDSNYQPAYTLLDDIKQIYLKQGINYIESAKHAKAIHPLCKASEIDSDDKDVWSNLGRAYYWLDDYANAVNCYQKAANLDPKDKTIYNNLGNAYYWIGEYEKAVGSFQKASELNPNCEKTYYYLARVYFKLENLDAAELAVEKALHIAPNYQEATELLGDIKLAADYKMVRIPAGEFQMGSNNSEAKDHEKPVHIVYVDEFYIDIHPVTNTEYKAFIDANPEWQKDHISRGDYLKHWNGNNYPQGKGNHPVTYMNWYAAMAYAQWTGKRLLTEAEWEKAARGGLTGQTYQSEDFMNASKANYNHAVAGTISVRTYPPNNYGLYDMTGNVREWCLDEYNSDFYKNSPRRNPMAGSNNIDETINSFKDVRTSRVLRGNSWRFIRQSVQVTRRFDYPPMYATDDIGFRCAKSVIG